MGVFSRKKKRNGSISASKKEKKRLMKQRIKEQKERDKLEKKLRKRKKKQKSKHHDRKETYDDFDEDDHISPIQLKHSISTKENKTNNKRSSKSKNSRGISFHLKTKRKHFQSQSTPSIPAKHVIFAEIEDEETKQDKSKHHHHKHKHKQHNNDKSR